MKSLRRLPSTFFISIFLLLLGSSLKSLASDRAREVRVYSGRHYNTDRQVFKDFAKKTGIRVRLFEATGISLIERLKREGKNSKADLILLVDAARIHNAAKAGLLQAYRFLADSRDNSTKERLESLGDPFSVFRCRGIMNCVSVCPKGLNPTRAIGHIKSMLVS